MRKNRNEITILIEAVPFGYGPASIATAIAEELRDEAKDNNIPIKLIALGKDVSYELFSSGNLFDEVWAFENYNLGSWHINIKEKVIESDIIISSIDPDFAKAVYNNFGKRVIFIDPLYWMWDEDPINVELCEKYYVLNFPGVSERVARVRNKLSHPDVLRIVDAIRDTRTLSKVSAVKTKNLLLINFGGMQYPFGSNVDLAIAMTEIILDVILLENIYDEIIICGGGTPIRQLAKSLNQVNEKVRIKVSPQKPIEFLKLLASSRTLITVPGMSIVYEALYFSKPTLFTLPLNYSQHLQVMVYKSMLKNAEYITWDDLEGYYTLPPGLPEEKGVRLAVELGKKFCSDLHAKSKFKNLIVEYFKSESLLKGIALSEKFNIEFNGANQIAKEILNEMGGDI